jgi:hypothetical protein
VWLRIVLPAAFLAAIFYGDLWIGITIPAAMLMLPLMFVAFPPTDFFRRRTVPIGAILLTGIVASVILQVVSGHPLAGKSDAVVFLPIAYAIATIVAFRRTVLPDEVIWRALVAGGLLTGAVMIVLAFTLQPGQFLIPGQDYVLTDQIFQQEKPTPAPASTKTGAPPLSAQTGAPPLSAETGAPPQASDAGAPPTFEFNPATDPSTTAFYATKELVKNALGRSNYIAVFFVVLFTVSLFRRSWFAAVFGALAVVTLSRFAIIFMACAGVLWWLHRRNVKTAWLVVGFLSASLAAVALMLVAAPFISLPSSFSSRVAYWQSGFEVGAYSPVFGLPRSEILNVFNFSIVWNPHDIFLWAFAISGLIGVAFYGAYVVVAFSAIHEASKNSTLWSGIFFGLIAVLAWSLVEIIAMTPAFEILLACLYSLARNRTLTQEHDGQQLADARRGRAYSWPSGARLPTDSAL